MIQVFVEFGIGVAPYQTQFLANNTQAKRKQYGMKHHVVRTIHADMGHTLQVMATEISRGNGNKKMRYKGQMIVIIRRTKLAKNIIF